MGDGGYQVVRMLIISVRHFTAVRRARRNAPDGKYVDTSENSDALGLGIKLQVRRLRASVTRLLMRSVWKKFAGACRNYVFAPCP